MSTRVRADPRLRRQCRRTASLKQKVRRLGSGRLQSWESATLSADHREQFWQRVLDIESAPSTTDFDRLIEAGVALPAPETLTDSQLHRTLWRVIAGLAKLRVFISHTDHLTDRELYTQLWTEVLREEVPLLDDDQSTCHVDLLGGWSEHDTQVFLRFYADDDWRRRWLEEFPDYQVPPREKPPYNRDRNLPKPHWRI